MTHADVLRAIGIGLVENARDHRVLLARVLVHRLEAHRQLANRRLHETAHASDLMRKPADFAGQALANLREPAIVILLLPGILNTVLAVTI